MPHLPLDSLDDRRLEPYRNLKFTSDMRRAGLFVAEGDKLVRRLLLSGLRVHSVLVGDRFLASGQLEIPPDVTTFVVREAWLRDLVGFKFHRGVLACGFRGAAWTLAEAMNQSRSIARPLVVGCIDIQDPTNLGTILRTAEAFDVTAVLLGGDCADPFSRRVLRVSMGAPLQLPLAHSADLALDLAALRQDWQMSLYAAVAGAASDPLERVSRPDRLAILFGNESCGLSPRWIELCDRRVSIPMSPRADSLNVAVATGIVLYHFARPGAE